MNQGDPSFARDQPSQTSRPEAEGRIVISTLQGTCILYKTLKKRFSSDEDDRFGTVS